MDKYLEVDGWNIIEEGFHSDKLRETESLFSLGNGRIGQRGNFEESYESDSLQGSYIAGVSYWDKTNVGWWKNGYPKFYSCIPNAPNWSGIKVRLINEELDLSAWDVDSFERKLNMKEGISHRNFEATSPNGNALRVNVEHLNHISDRNLCLIKYKITSLNYKGKISFVPFIDGGVSHKSTSTGKNVWDILRAETTNDYAYLWVQTKRQNSQVCMSMTYDVYKNGEKVSISSPIRIEKEKLVGYSLGLNVKVGDTIELIKYVSVVPSLYVDRFQIVDTAVNESLKAKMFGWTKLCDKHKRFWAKAWDDTNVTIEGDDKAQQGIRFNIFQLHQTYHGDDPRLNIGSKGFTGEKYGGNTFWNTELCCIPYFLLSTSKYIGRNLLLYRYHQLDKAIANAAKLGFDNGAALYPMVTISGDECHNEWEITFEEIHRNGIIAYAISNYIKLTGDDGYLLPYGLKVLIAISRFWKQRVSFSSRNQKYMLLGVTGPNEYENNVNNNWYTNYSCVQCLKDTIKYCQLVSQKSPADFERFCKELHFDFGSESSVWEEIIEKMYFPTDSSMGIFLQQDGYLDKEMLDVKDIPISQRPINQHWSWDRILRSCFIKQSDVLLGLYLYNNHFDKQTILKNYEFYESKTVHESSLSPFVHCILAAQIGDIDKAYELFMRSTRLDLDDYNRELKDGLHITSMAGSWLAIVYGFSGMQITDGVLSFSPSIPKQWTSYQYIFNYMEYRIRIKISKEIINLELLEGDSLQVTVKGKIYTFELNEVIKIAY